MSHPGPSSHPVGSVGTTPPPAPVKDASSPGSGRAASDASAVLPSTAQALLHRIAVEQAKVRTPALMAGVVRDGARVWHGARGHISTSKPDNDTQSRIGSITKTFTAVLIARLRDEGLLRFSDRVERHIPGTALGDRTLAQLLSHTSGTQAERDGAWWERTPGADWSALAVTLGPGTLRHDAGRRFHYSNLGYAVLGEVVARLRGRSWWDSLRQEVLEPLGLRRTTYLPEPPHASGFAVHPWADVVLPEPAHDSVAMAPAGQLWSTVDDLGRWASFLAGDTGDVLDGETLAEMYEPHAIDEAPGSTSGYGLGWQIVRDETQTLIGHGGSMPGFLAGLYVDLDAGVGAVALANTTSGLDTVALGRGLINTVIEAEPRLPAEWRPTSLPDGVLDLVGPWYWGPTAFIVHARAGGRLELSPVRNGRASRFVPCDDGTWTGLDGYYAGETLRVIRDPDGRVSHLDLATFVLTRTPYDTSAPVPGGVDPAGWSADHSDCDD